MKYLEENVSAHSAQLESSTDLEIADCTTQEQASRRRFLKNASLAGMSALVGMNIPFEGNLPSGFVPAAMAQDSPMTGKDGLTLLNDRPVNAETPPELLDDPITPTNRHFVRNNGLVPDNTSAD